MAEQFRGKDKLIAPNVEALRHGPRLRCATTARAPAASRCARADAVGDRIFIDGNDAAGLGCVYGGATVAAWYPITPSTSLAEAFAKHCRKFRVDPDTGRAPLRHRPGRGRARLDRHGRSARPGTARAPSPRTSGPGISLMQEFIGLAYFAEIPAVIFDVQRGGPSTGMPTRTQQSDLLVCRLRLATATPSTSCCSPRIPSECFEMAAEAFDLADRLQTTGLRACSTSTSA